MSNRRLACVAACVLASLSQARGQDPAGLREAIGDAALAPGWIYEDVDAGFAAARKSGKPLLVAFR